MPEEVGPIIPCKRIELEHVGEGMEGAGCEAILIDVCESAHRAAIAYAKQVKVVGMLAIGSQHRNGIEP